MSLQHNLAKRVRAKLARKSSMLQSYVSTRNSMFWFTVFAFGALMVSRVSLASFIGEMGPFGDEDNYVRRGMAFWRLVGNALTGVDSPQAVADEFYYNGYWPPLYSLLIAPIVDAFGYAGARMFGAIIDIASGALIFRIAGRVSSSFGAALAVLIFAVVPTFAVASVNLMSETLHNFFLLGAIYQWLRLMDEKVEATSLRGVSAWCVLGLLMAAAILVRASFLVMFISLFISTVVLSWKRVRVLAGLGLATLVMMVGTIPWNVYIAHREGQFMFMQTLSAAQLSAKFSHEGLGYGWNEHWTGLHDEARSRNVHYTDVAMERVENYFADNAGTPGVIGALATRQLVTDYLFGGTPLSERLRRGFYPDGGGALFTVLVWQEAVRLPLLLVGLIGLLFPLGSFRYRGHFVLLTAATFGIAVLGVVSGRHLISSYLFFVFSAAVVLDWLKGQRLHSSVWTWSALPALGLVSVFVWSAFPSDPTWTARYRSQLLALGVPVDYSDSVRLRRFPSCFDRLIVGPLPGDDARLFVRDLEHGTPEQRMEPGEFLPDSPLIELLLRNGPADQAPYLLIYSGEKPVVFDLTHGRATEWQTALGTCVRYNE